MRIKKKRAKGKLIVIDGSDGSGKATQTKRLVARLKKAGLRVRTLDFPQYDHNFFGAFVHACLHGKYGDFLSLDPYITSVLYAADRFESKEKLSAWLAQGDIVILDRYVSANQIHQGGKISSAVKRNKFLAWLDKMEFDVFGLPRPQMTIYLDVPVKVSQKLLATSGKVQDDAEKNIAYLTHSRTSALRLAKTGKGWHRVQCVARGKLRSIEDIHEEIIDLCVRHRIVRRSMVK